MENKKPIVLPGARTLREISKELNIDPDKLRMQTESFKEWLKSESHLPDIVDEQLIQNILRANKCNFEKSKINFERFLASRIKLKQFYENRCFDETYFTIYSVHRLLVISPTLTPKGYRIIFIRYPEYSAEFDFQQLVNYMLLIKDYLLHEDVSAGYIYVCDQKYFATHHLAKFDVKLVLMVSNILANIYPIRIKKVHLIRTPQMADIIINLLKKVLNEKIRKRFVDHRYLSDLLDFVPKDMLPKEYGGCGEDLDEQAEKTAEYFVKNRDLANKIRNLKLTGPIPSNKKNLYHVEDFEMAESYRLVL